MMAMNIGTIREIIPVSSSTSGGDCQVQTVSVDQRARKRQNDGLSEFQPEVKQEKSDSGYDQAELANLPVLGTVTQCYPGSFSVPRPTQNVNTRYDDNHMRGSTQPQQRPRKSRSNTARTQNRNVVYRPMVPPNYQCINSVAPNRLATSLRPIAVTSQNGRIAPPCGVALLNGTSQSGSPVIVVVSRSSDMARTGSTQSSTAAFSRPIVRLGQTRNSAKTTDAMERLKLRLMVGKSILEKYVAPKSPPPELHMAKRASRVCQGCGDEFTTNVGLVDHISRKSMVISFHCICNALKWPRLFYNPCAFASFYHAHSLRPGMHVPRDAATISVWNPSAGEKRSGAGENRPAETQAQQSSTASTASTSEPLLQLNTSTISDVGHRNLSNSTCEPVPATEPAIKEIHVTLEVQPGQHEDANITCSERSQAQEKSVLETKSKVRSRREVQSKKTTVALAGNSAGTHQLADFSAALDRYQTVCPECTASYKTRSRLATHFAHKRGTVALSCEICGMTLPNQCAYSAHVRLHSTSRPFVCPACGVNFVNAESTEVLRTHVEKQCRHMSDTRFVSLRDCPRCEFRLPVADGAEMVRHTLDVHAVIYYKCGSCPQAFTSQSVADRHAQTTGHNAQHHVVRKCPSCATVFNKDTAEEIQSHIIAHLSATQFRSPNSSTPPGRNSQSADQFFTQCCEVCGDLFADRKQLFRHVSARHSDYLERVMQCLFSGVDSNNSGPKHAQPENQNQPKDSSTSDLAVSNVESTTVPASKASTSLPKEVLSKEVSFECERCQMEFDSEESFKRHQAKHRFLAVKKKQANRKSAKKKSDDSSLCDPLQQVPIPKEYVCKRCSRNFNSDEALTKHISTVHGSPSWHFCLLCADGFSSAAELQRHTSAQHSGRIRSHALTCSMCEKSNGDSQRSFANRCQLTKHLRNTHGIPRQAASIMARDAASAVESSSSETDIPTSSSPSNSVPENRPVKRLFVSGQSSTYQCSRCDFSAEDRAVFVTHAAEHSPVVVGAAQCKECAASFTGGQALYRHLRIVHRMDRDIDVYLSENGGDYQLSLDLSVEDVEPSTPTESVRSSPMSGVEKSPENVEKAKTPVTANEDDDSGPAECTVCYRVFLTKQLLRGHMRVHGMAFIQGTRRKLAASIAVANGK